MGLIASIPQLIISIHVPREGHDRAVLLGV